MVNVHSVNHTTYRRVTETFGNSLPVLPKESYICDAGCSWGCTTFELRDLYPNNKIIGFDIDPSNIRGNNLGLDLRCADMFDFFRETDLRFAGIFAMNNVWIGHNEGIVSDNQVKELFTDMKRRLVLGGAIAVSYVSFFKIYYPDSKIEYNSGHFNADNSSFTRLLVDS